MVSNTDTSGEFVSAQKAEELVVAYEAAQDSKWFYVPNLIGHSVLAELCGEAVSLYANQALGTKVKDIQETVLDTDISMLGYEPKHSYFEFNGHSSASPNFPRSNTFGDELTALLEGSANSHTFNFYMPGTMFGWHEDSEDRAKGMELSVISGIHGAGKLLLKGVEDEEPISLDVNPGDVVGLLSRHNTGAFQSLTHAAYNVGEQVRISHVLAVYDRD